MDNQIVHIDCREIGDVDAFHDVFARELGFPDFYGRNMDAWIDCMTSLDAPDHGMTSVHVRPGSVLVLSLDGMRNLRRRCPGIANDLEECTAFVNYRRIDVGQAPVLALSYAD